MYPYNTGTPSFATDAVGGGSGSDFPTWTQKTYLAGQKVNRSGTFYVSLVDGNADAPPSAKWQSFAMNDPGV